MTGLVPALVDAYRKLHPEIEFQLDSTGAQLGFRTVLDGNADLVASGRPASPVEEEQATVLGFSFATPQARHIVAVDVVGVEANARNPVESLDYDQVIGVFCKRSIQSWSALGGPDRPIHAVVPGLESPSRALFEDFFCGPSGIDRHLPTLSPADLAKTVASDPDALSLTSLAEAQGKLLGLAPDQGLPAVRPTIDNVTRGSYPLYGDLYLFTRGAPTGALASFLQWVESPGGQEVVDDARFVPLFLRPSRLDEARPLRETVHFEPGASEPDSRSMARLDLLVAEIRERQVHHVVLEGYTDGQEGNPYVLADQRAQAVRKLLTAQVPDLYFEVIPRGPKSPIAPNDTPMGRLINRRVQVYLGEDEREPAEAATASKP
jgi:phosphate transport system substrate-binding protein